MAQADQDLLELQVLLRLTVAQLEQMQETSPITIQASRLKRFSGEPYDMNWKDWEKQFSRISIISGATTLNRKVALLSTYLYGPALVYFSELETKNPALQSWIEWSSAFLDRFPDNRQIDIKIEQLLVRSQIANEKVTIYAEDIRRLAKRAFPRWNGLGEIDTMVKNHFINHLTPNIRRWVQNAEPVTFEEAVAEAEKQESREVEHQNFDSQQMQSFSQSMISELDHIPGTLGTVSIGNQTSVSHDLGQNSQNGKYRTLNIQEVFEENLDHNNCNLTQSYGEVRSFGDEWPQQNINQNRDQNSTVTTDGTMTCLSCGRYGHSVANCSYYQYEPNQDQSRHFTRCTPNLNRSTWREGSSYCQMPQMCDVSDSYCSQGTHKDQYGVNNQQEMEGVNGTEESKFEHPESYCDYCNCDNFELLMNSDVKPPANVRMVHFLEFLDEADKISMGVRADPGDGSSDYPFATTHGEQPHFLPAVELNDFHEFLNQTPGSVSSLTGYLGTIEHTSREGGEKEQVTREAQTVSCQEKLKLRKYIFLSWGNSFWAPVANLIRLRGLGDVDQGLTETPANRLQPDSRTSSGRARQPNVSNGAEGCDEEQDIRDTRPLDLGMQPTTIQKDGESKLEATYRLESEEQLHRKFCNSEIEALSQEFFVEQLRNEKCYFCEERYVRITARSTLSQITRVISVTFVTHHLHFMVAPVGCATFLRSLYSNYGLTSESIFEHCSPSACSRSLPQKQKIFKNFELFTFEQICVELREQLAIDHLDRMQIDHNATIKYLNTRRADPRNIALCLISLAAMKLDHKQSIVNAVTGIGTWLLRPEIDTEASQESIVTNIEIQAHQSYILGILDNIIEHLLWNKRTFAEARETFNTQECTVIDHSIMDGKWKMIRTFRKVKFTSPDQLANYIIGSSFPYADTRQLHDKWIAAEIIKANRTFLHKKLSTTSMQKISDSLQKFTSLKIYQPKSILIKDLLHLSPNETQSMNTYKACVQLRNHPGTPSLSWKSSRIQKSSRSKIEKKLPGSKPDDEMDNSS